MFILIHIKMGIESFKMSYGGGFHLCMFSVNLRWQCVAGPGVTVKWIPLNTACCHEVNKGRMNT